MDGYKHRAPSQYESNNPLEQDHCLSRYIHFQWPLLKTLLLCVSVIIDSIFILMTPIPVLGGYLVYLEV
jgi:hypothetical protein